MKIILIGPPGTGKGTQAKRLSKYLNIPVISSGDLIRDEVEKKTEFGLMAKDYVDKGEFVPDDKIIDFINTRLKQFKKGFILDGYPRNINQTKNLEIDKVVYIDSSRENIIKRLLGRARKQGRSDDTAEIIEKRLDIFDKETKPLLKFYKEKLIIIDGDKSMDKVFNDIIGGLKWLRFWD